MHKSKTFIGLLVILYLGFVFFQFANNLYWAIILDALILPLISVGYFTINPKPNLFFSIFLLSYAFSDLIAGISQLDVLFITKNIPYLYLYFIGNSFYIIAYLALLIKILKSVSFSHIIKNFKLHVIVLLVLNIYIAYVLQVIINPYMDMTVEYIIEIMYNVSMLLVLTASLLNYLYREDRKALYLFIGSIAIVFSEVIAVAYLYVDAQDMLNVLSTTLTLLAFYFYCKQSRLRNEVNQFAT